MKDKGKTATLTQTLLTSKKTCLYICFALTALCDWFLFFILLYAQVAFLYLLIPMVFGIMEVFLFLAILLSGFRFRYSMAVPAVYTVLALGAVAAVVLWRFTGGGQSVMTDAAVGFWAGFHVFACIAILLTAVFAAGRGGAAKTATVVLCVLFATAAGLYAYHLAVYGFFGQGTGEGFYAYETRTVVYEYDEEGDSYEAVSALAGRGGSVVIPEEYNGKKVTKVNYSLFADGSVKEVRIENKEFTFSGEENFPQTLGDALLISCEKTRVDEFRNALYREGLEGHSAAYFEFASRIVPIVEENEVYIAFNYTESSLLRAGEVALATWVKPAGTVFRLEEYGDIDYIRHADNESEYDLCWSYVNMDGYIFRTLTDEDGTPLEGHGIERSLTAQAVFGQVHRVRVGEDNDDIYEVEDGFKQFDFDGVKQGCRYVIAAEADKLLQEMPAREGFTLRWAYEKGEEREAFTSLASVLEEEETPVIHPVWQLLPPVIATAETDITQNGANRTVYGEAVTFRGEATPPADGFTLTYEWRYSGVNRASDATFTIDKVVPAQSGEYTFVAKAAAPTITSLTSEAEQTVLLSVGKRTVRFNWNLPSDFVYSGTDKTVSCSPNAEDVAHGDEIAFTLTQSTVRDAKAYTVGLSLNAEWQEFYEISPESRERSFSVSPYALRVEWAPHAFVYTGREQCPSATANGVGEDGSVDITVTGGQTHAGSGYTAHASVSDPNYTISNADEEFSIEQKELTVTWDGEKTFTYDGTEHTLQATVSGEENGESVTLTYAGGGTNARTEPYTMSASLPESGNYKFAGGYTVTEQFTITQKQISLVWQESKTFTYDGAQHGIAVVSVTDAVEGEQSGVVASIEYSGYATNAKKGAYTMTAAIPQDGNYKLAGDTYTATEQFTVTQKQIALVWQSNRQFTYNGAQQGISVTSVTDAVSGEESGIIASISYSGYATNAKEGAYTMTATIPQDGNYRLADGYSATETFTIARAPLTIVWQQDRRLEYSGEEQSLTAEIEGIVGGEESKVRSAVQYEGAATNAGSHTMKATLQSSLTDYTIGSGAECAYEITKKVVTVTWQEVRSFVYNGQTHTLTVTVQGTVKDESLVPTVSEGGKDVGTHSVTATIPSDGNYTFASGYTVSQSYTVTAAPLTVTWTGDKQVEYDGQQHTLQAEVKGAVAGEEELVRTHVTVVGSFRDVGEHTVTLQLGPELGNYAIAEGETCTLTITKKELTITLTEASKEYDGTPYTGFAYTYTDLADGDSIGEVVTVSYEGEAVTAKDVGRHKLEAKLAEGVKYGNYTVTASEAYITITAKQLTITLTEGSKVYDGKPYTAFAYTNSELAEGDSIDEVVTVSYEGEAVTAVNVGRHKVVAQLSEGIKYGNYTVTAAEAYITITPKQLTITVMQGSKVYDGKPYAEFTYTHTDLADGDTMEEIGTVTYKGEAVTDKNVGRHSVEAEIAEDDKGAKYDNYELAFVGTSIEITAAEVTLTWPQDNTFEEDDTPKTFKAEAKGILEEDAGSVHVEYHYFAEGGSEVPEPKEAGKYTVHAELVGEGKDNYTLKEAESSFEITAREDVE